MCAIVPGLATAKGKGKQKPPPKADLRISKFETDRSDPMWAVVGTDGVLFPIKVDMTIVNDGNKKAGPSTADVVIVDSKHHRFVHRFPVPAIRPHKHYFKTVTFRGDKASLGFARISAQVDINNNVPESSYNDNFWPSGDPFSTHHEGEKFPILAQEWDVTTFSVTGTDAFRTLTTSARDNFRFVLSSFDGRKFDYLPYGSVDNHVTETGICSGTSDETRTHNPWQHGSFFDIDSDLGGYEAAVASGSESYSINISCIGLPGHTEHDSFLELATYIGPTNTPAMSPTDTTIDRSFTDSRVHTTWKWTFKAKLG
ncbi:MAG: hypothetical protein ACXVJ3_14780 [Ilumatobacteraceae bacterium]